MALIDDILKGVKKVIIPIIIGIITFPILSVFQYKGLIVKEPLLATDKNSLQYELTSTSDSIYKNIIISFNSSIPDSLIVSEEFRMYITPNPFDRNWANSAVERYGNSDSTSESIIVAQIKKGEYILNVPIKVKKFGKDILKDGNTSLVFCRKTLDNPFSDIISYRWYHWIFFNRWKASALMLLITLIAQFIYTIFKKK